MSSRTNEIAIGGLKDWLAALQDAQGKPSNAAGVTTADLAASMGVTVDVATERLRQMIRSGRARYAGTRTGTKINNARCQTPVYALVQGKKK